MEGDDWATASELAEYAYCPRAWYYRRQFPDAPTTASEAAGQRYHARLLGGEARRAGRGGLYWIGAVVGAVAIALAAVGVFGR